ncbi:hypothetical protein FRC15_001197 [Serendipita sp. 397]|nr:hypothetical protein FRC15_001197 [Serendipita sp. 397]
MRGIHPQRAILVAVLVLFTPVYLPGFLILLGQLLLWDNQLIYLVFTRIMALFDVFVPLSVGIELLWEQRCGLSSEARMRSARRVSEALLGQSYTPKTKRLAFRFLSIPFLAISFLALASIILVHHALLSVSIISIPLLVLYASGQLAALPRSTYRRYLGISTNLGWTTSPTPPLTLPTEIWEKIIEFALDIPEYFGSNCQPKDLPYFLHLHRMLIRHSWKLDPYRRLEQPMHQLRLVSRMWNNITNRHSKQWRRFLDNQRFLHSQRVDIILPSDLESASVIRSYGDRKLCALPPPPMLTILCIRDQSTRAEVVEQRISTLTKNPVGFLKCVESLAYQVSKVRLSPTAISKLSSSFASLTVLILESRRIEGIVLFPHLHTLEISTKSCNLDGWRCPNLRHFSFYSWSNNDPLIEGCTDGIIPIQFDHLQALVVIPLRAQLNTEFWLRYPQLQLFGCSDMTLVDRPPSNHQLKHIYIYNNVYKLSVERLSTIIDSLRGGSRTLYINATQWPTGVEQRVWDQWQHFYEKCRADGIAWRSISPIVEPEYVQLPFMREGWAGQLERIMVNWVLEINLSVSLVIVYCVSYDTTVVRGPQELALVVSAFVIYGVLHLTCPDLFISV